MPKDASTAPRFLPSLEGLRGWAALMVVFYHVNWPSHVAEWRIVQNAYVFVDVFFVLSGFVITHVYGQRLTSLAKVGRFFWLRIARLYPLHLFTLLVLVAWRVVEAIQFARTGADWTLAFSGIFTFESLATNLLLIHSLGIHDRLTWNNPSWSISTEFYTYALFTLLAGSAWLRRHAWLSRGLLLIAAYALLFALAENLDVTYSLGAFRCLAGFLLGSLVYTIVDRYGRLDRAPARSDSVVEVALLAGVLIAIATFAGKAQLLLIPLFALLLLVTIGSHGVVTRALTSPLGLWLGKVSYSVYMLHWPIRVGFEKVLTALGRPPNDPASLDAFAGDGVVVIYGAVVLVAATLTYRWVERPWRSRARRWLAAREAG